MKIAEMLAEKTAVLLFRELDEVAVVSATLRASIEKTKRDLEDLDVAMLECEEANKNADESGDTG